MKDRVFDASGRKTVFIYSLMGAARRPERDPVESSINAKCPIKMPKFVEVSRFAPYHPQYVVIGDCACMVSGQ